MFRYRGFLLPPNVIAAILTELNMENRMADNLNNRGPRDAATVNVNEEWELDYWSKKFGVSKEALKDAVAKVGISASTVAAHFNRLAR